MTEVASLMRRLDEFILEAERTDQRIQRREIRTEHVRIYVRVGPRGVPDRHNTARCFVIADITVAEAYRSRGIFHLMLAWLEQREPFDGIFVENVGGLRLAEFLQRRGYHSYPTGSFQQWWRRHRHPPTAPLA